MGCSYDIKDLVYASGYEKMYGVSDEQMAFLAHHQENLRRFAVAPTFDDALVADLERLELKRSALAAEGYDPTFERNSASEAFRIEFAHTTTALEGNGLTLAETAMVLEQDLSIPGKPLCDHLEVVDADKAFCEGARPGRRSAALSEEVVFEVHRLVAGQFGKRPIPWRVPLGYALCEHVAIYPPPAKRVPELMAALLSSPLVQPR